MSLPRLIAASAVCLLVACTDTNPPTTPAPYVPPTAALRVSGRLIDFHTAQGVAGMEMRWLPFTAGGPQFASVTAVSDTTGAFQVDLPVAERFSLQFSSPGQSGLVIVPGKQLDTTLLVNPGTCAARYGTVIDAVTRQPIAGARVSRARTAETDAHGYYRIDIGCDPKADWGFGTTIVSVQHPAYEGAFEFDGRREGTSVSGIRRVDFALRPLGAAGGSARD
jgi:hypothetical protein